MNKYVIHSENLNNSLAFYHALLESMPHRMSSNEIHFQLNNLSLRIEEGNSSKTTDNIMFFPLQRREVASAYHRMERFLGKEKWMENCDRLDDAFGIEDPDGNKWKVGNPESNVLFEKCYY